MSNTKILHKRSSTYNVVPLIADLEFGELGMNVNDGKIFIKRDNGGGEEIITFNSNTATASVTDIEPSNPENGDIWVNSFDGSLLVYYHDGTIGQWIQPRTQAILTMNSIDELSDVDTSSNTKTQGDILTWNGTDNWENKNEINGGEF